MKSWRRESRRVPERGTEGEMPKERIPVDRGLHGDVIVAWGRDGGSVQVATTVSDPDWVRGLANEWCKATDEEIIGDANGWHLDLSRDQVNTLIRFLRRARDQAFGRDE